jgi:hypothetical protein
MKHLKKISLLLKESSPADIVGVASIERWLPFILESLRTYQVDFPQEELDEMTLQEFHDTWNTIAQVSGIKIVGEKKPSETLTGASSMDASVSPSAGTTGTSTNIH